MLPASHFDFQQNYFQLFGLEPCFQIDIRQLEYQYRELQSQVHPDRYTHLSHAEQRIALQRATLVNEAYQTLRTPVDRARYLLQLQGVDTQEESNTHMPVDFLMLQMEWREALQEILECKDVDGLDHLESRLSHEKHQMEQALQLVIDDQKDFIVAAEWVRKLRFMEKLAEEISAAYDLIEE